MANEELGGLADGAGDFLNPISERSTLGGASLPRLSIPAPAKRSGAVGGVFVPTQENVEERFDGNGYVPLAGTASDPDVWGARVSEDGVRVVEDVRAPQRRLLRGLTKLVNEARENPNNEELSLKAGFGLYLLLNPKAKEEDYINSMERGEFGTGARTASGAFNALTSMVGDKGLQISEVADALDSGETTVEGAAETLGLDVGKYGQLSPSEMASQLRDRGFLDKPVLTRWRAARADGLNVIETRAALTIAGQYRSGIDKYKIASDAPQWLIGAGVKPERVAKVAQWASVFANEDMSSSFGIFMDTFGTGANDDVRGVFDLVSRNTIERFSDSLRRERGRMDGGAFFDNGSLPTDSGRLLRREMEKSGLPFPKESWKAAFPESGETSGVSYEFSSFEQREAFFNAAEKVVSRLRDQHVARAALIENLSRQYAHGETLLGEAAQHSGSALYSVSRSIPILLGGITGVAAAASYIPTTAGDVSRKAVAKGADFDSATVAGLGAGVTEAGLEFVGGKVIAAVSGLSRFGKTALTLGAGRSTELAKLTNSELASIYVDRTLAQKLGKGALGMAASVAEELVTETAQEASNSGFERMATDGFSWDSFRSGAVEGLENARQPAFIGEVVAATLLLHGAAVGQRAQLRSRDREACLKHLRENPDVYESLRELGVFGENAPLNLDAALSGAEKEQIYMGMVRQAFGAQATARFMSALDDAGDKKATRRAKGEKGLFPTLDTSSFVMRVMGDDAQTRYDPTWSAEQKETHIRKIAEETGVKFDKRMVKGFDVLARASEAALAQVKERLRVAQRAEQKLKEAEAETKAETENGGNAAPAPQNSENADNTIPMPKPAQAASTTRGDGQGSAKPGRTLTDENVSEVVQRFISRHGDALGDANISNELRELFLPKPEKDGKPKPRTVSPKKNPKHKKPKTKANVETQESVELDENVMNALKGLRARAYSAFQFESALEAYAESCRKDLQTRTSKENRAERLGFYAAKHAGVTNGVGSFAEFMRYSWEARAEDRNRVEMSALTEKGRVKLIRMMKKLFGIELEIGAVPSWASASDRAKIVRGEVNGIFDGDRAWVSDVNGLVGTTLHEAVWHNVWAQCAKARAKLELLGERVTPEEKERLEKLAALGDKMKEYVANVPQWLRDRVAAEYGYGERGGAEVAEVLEEVGAFLFETEFEQELLDELDDASHKWWTKVRGLFAKAFSLVTGRGEDSEASFERAGGLSDAHAAMREMMDAVLASDGVEAVGVGEEGEEGDENDGKDERYSRADLSEWRIEDKADYGRLASQVGTYWHDRAKVDAYYFDGFVFICVKGKNFGDFTVADVFNVDIPYEEFEARRTAVVRGLAYRKANGDSRRVGLIRDAYRFNYGGASRAENGGDAERDASGVAGTLRPDGQVSDSRSSYDGDGVYTPDGRLFARRVRDGRRNSVVRDGGEVVPLDAEEAGKKLSELVDDGDEVDVGGVSYSVVRPGKAFHVSAADFEKFDSSFMGTGEGSQYYGWGMYFLTRPRVWRNYREQFTRFGEAKELTPEMLKNASDLEKIYSEKVEAVKPIRENYYDLLHQCRDIERKIGEACGRVYRKLSATAEDVRIWELACRTFAHIERVNSAPDNYDVDCLLKNVLSFKREVSNSSCSLKQELLDVLESIDPLLEKARALKPELVSSKRAFDIASDSAMRAYENWFAAKTGRPVVRPYTYRVEFDETAENMLDWTKELTREQFDKFLTALQKRNPELATFYESYRDRPPVLSRLHTDARAIDRRDISLALDDAGFIGHTMPVGGTHTDDYRHGHNYVIYNADERVRVTGKVRFSKVRGNGKNKTNGTVETEYLEPSDFGEDGRVKPEILTEIEAEKAKILEDAQKNGSFMKAPNGAPSKLDAEQWVLVRTKRFKRWFGDWEAATNRKDEKDAGGMGHNGVSKVVDENGEPKVVYRGETVEGGEYYEKHIPVFYTPNFEGAKSYGDFDSKNVFAAFINSRNPLYLGYAESIEAENAYVRENAYVERLLSEASAEKDAEKRSAMFKEANARRKANDDAYYASRDRDRKKLFDAIDAFNRDRGGDVEIRRGGEGVYDSISANRYAFFDWARSKGYDMVVANSSSSDVSFKIPEYVVVGSPSQVKSATQNVGTYASGNPDIRYSMPRGGRKLKDYEFFVTDTAAFNRLRSQIGTLWHDKDDIDAYYLDEFVFICKKGDEYGKFEILDILNQNSTPDEIERRKEEAKRRMAQLQARSFADANEVYRNEVRLGLSDSAGLGNRGGAIRDDSRASQSDERDAAFSDAEGDLSRDVVGSQDGRLFAYRVGGEFGRRHHRRILSGEYSRESYLDKYGLDVKIPEGGYKGLRASRVRRDSQRNFEDMIDERVRACAAKTLASGADRRGEVLLTNDVRNMGAAERSYIKAKVMQICQIVRAAAKNRSFTPAEARGAVAMAAYNLAQSDLYSSAYEQIYCGAATEASVRDKMQEEEKARARGERPEQLALPAGYSKSAGEAARKLKLASGQAVAMEQSERQEERRAASFRSRLSEMREKYGKDGKAASEVEAMDGFIKDALDGALPDATITKLRGIRDGLVRGEYEAREGADEAEQTALRNRLAAAGDVLTEATRALGIAKAMLERGMPSVKDAAAQNRADAADRESDARESDVEDAFEDLDPATEARRVVAQLAADAWNKVLRALGVEGADAGFDASKDDPSKVYHAFQSSLATARAQFEAKLEELDAHIKSGVFTTDEKLEMNAERNRMLDALRRFDGIFDEGSDFVRAFKQDVAKLAETALGNGSDGRTLDALGALERAQTLADAVAAAHELLSLSARQSSEARAPFARGRLLNLVLGLPKLDERVNDDAAYYTPEFRVLCQQLRDVAREYWDKPFSEVRAALDALADSKERDDHSRAREYALTLIGGGGNMSSEMADRAFWRILSMRDFSFLEQREKVRAMREEQRERAKDFVEALGENAHQQEGKRSRGGPRQGIFSVGDRLRGLIKRASGVLYDRAEAFVIGLERDLNDASVRFDTLRGEQLEWEESVCKRIFGKGWAAALYELETMPVSAKDLKDSGRFDHRRRERLKELTPMQILNIYMSARQKSFQAVLAMPTSLSEKDPDALLARQEYVRECRDGGELDRFVRTWRGGALWKLKEAWRARWAQLYPQLNAAYREVYGFDMFDPFGETDYYPLGYHNGSGIGEPGAIVLAVGRRFQSRVLNTNELNAGRSFLSVVHDQMMETMHAIAYAGTHLNVERMFFTDEFLTALETRVPKADLDGLKSHLTRVLGTPAQLARADESKVGPLMMQSTSFVALAGSWMCMLKQALSAGTLLGESDFGVAQDLKAGLFPLRVTAFLSDAKAFFAHPAAKARWDEYARSRLDDALRGKLTTPGRLLRRLKDILMSPVGLGDAIAALMGLGYYHEYYVEALDKGMDEASARDWAAKRYMDQFEKCQQTRRATNMTSLQRNPSSVARMLTQFRTQNDQAFSNELRSFADVFGSGKAGLTSRKRWKKLGKRVFAYHLLYGAAQDVVLQLVLSALADGDDDDDKPLWERIDWRQTGVAMLLGGAKGSVVGSLLFGFADTYGWLSEALTGEKKRVPAGTVLSETSAFSISERFVRESWRAGKETWYKLRDENPNMPEFPNEKTWGDIMRSWAKTTGGGRYALKLYDAVFGDEGDDAEYSPDGY